VDRNRYVTKRVLFGIIFEEGTIDGGITDRIGRIRALNVDKNNPAALRPCFAVTPRPFERLRARRRIEQHGNADALRAFQSTLGQLRLGGKKTISVER